MAESEAAPAVAAAAVEGATETAVAMETETVAATETAAAMEAETAAAKETATVTEAEMAEAKETAAATEAETAAAKETAAATEAETTEGAAVNLAVKREREEEGDAAAGDEVEGAAGEETAPKKAKLDEEAKEVAVKLGPKEFGSAVEMFEYFIGLLHAWSPHLDINKYEHMVLADLLKKGHNEPENKIGPGIQAFEVRMHPVWQSRCFFIRRVDGSMDDFSFRKCVDNILPLPEELKIVGKSSNGKKSGGHQKGGGGRGGRGGGRGGWRGRGRR